MVSKSPHNLWVGLSDLGKEGSYRLMNGTKYDPGNKSIKALYYWEDNEPNGEEVANCVHYWHTNNGFADTPCDYDVEGGGARDHHGLCEIKNYNCLDEV